MRVAVRRALILFPCQPKLFSLTGHHREDFEKTMKYSITEKTPLIT